MQRLFPWRAHGHRKEAQSKENPMSRAAARVVVAVVLALPIAICPPSAWAVASINGHGRYEKIKGKPAMGYVELYEVNLFISPPNSSIVGPSRRLGTTCQSGGVCDTTIITHDGCYCADNLPAGTYSFLLNQPLFYVAPKVVSNITISNGQSVTINSELPIDYSTNFKNDWTGPGNRWYQTFVATGTSIRGIMFAYAGDDPSNVEVAVLEDNGNASVANWRLVGARIEPSVADVTDNWVRWRSYEIPTMPGVRYAVRLTANGGSGNLQPYKRNKDGNSYAYGRAYDAQGNAQNFDLNITVFSDNDGTIVTMNRRVTGLGYMCDGGFFGTRWGQTFIAKGKGLAGADVWAAGANYKWDLEFLWRVRQGGPTGPQIGPDKITLAAYQAFGVGLHGVSYNPGEVPLTRGQTYFIEFNSHNPPPESVGFNPYLMKPASGASCGGGDESDSFSEGIAYRDNVARPDDDLAMTILEYGVVGPEITLNKDSISRSTFLGDPTGNDTFTVFNSGIETLNYTVSEVPPVDWLSVSPTGGSSTSETDTITVSYLTAGLPAGHYTTTIRVSGNAVNSPKDISVTVDIDSVKPDFDHDGDVDQQDFGHLQECFTGPGVSVTEPTCLDAALDNDDDVDIDDYAVLQNCTTGDGVTATRDCAG